MIHKIIKKLGTLTGSRALKCHTESSDYDYFVTESDFKFINELVSKQNIKVKDSQYITDTPKNILGDYNSMLLNIGNVKFSYKDKVINLLVYKDSDEFIFNLMTRSYQNMREHHKRLYKVIKKDKLARILVFRQSMLHAKLYNSCIFNEEGQNE